MSINKHGREVTVGITCNDRKFEEWLLVGYQRKDGKLSQSATKVQVYASPKNGCRGAETECFKISINGFVVISPDLSELRKQAIAVVRNLSEDDHEKVLIVKTSGRPNNYSGTTLGDEFGLTWSIGWRVKALDVVFNETRNVVVPIDNYEEDYQPDMDGQIIMGAKLGHRGKQLHKTAVLSWSQEREDMLNKAVIAIGKMRDDLNLALLQPESFAALLDGRAALLLVGEGNDHRSISKNNGAVEMLKHV